MNTIGLRHQCICKAVANLDIALDSIGEAARLLDDEYQTDRRQLVAIKGMLSQFRKLIAEKSLTVRLEIDGK